MQLTLTHQRVTVALTVEGVAVGTLAVETGPQGPAGPAGPAGAAGPQGEKGDAGTANIVALKTVDETRTETADLAVDADLQVTLEAGRTYRVEARLHYRAHPTPDFKAGLDVVSGLADAQMIWTFPGVSALGNTLGGSQNSAGGGFAQDRQTVFVGVIATALQGGVLAVYWAQQTSNAEVTILSANSYLLATPLD